MSANEAVWWAVTIDSVTPRQLAAFWSTLLGAPVIEVGGDRTGWFRIQPLAPMGPFVNFQPVAASKVGKTRLHLDVFVTDLPAAIARVVELGGRDTGMRETLQRGQVAVMQDPEGNEFCLLAPPR